MARNANSLVNLATAFVLGLTTNTALAESPAPAAPAQTTNPQTGPRMIADELRTAVITLGDSIRNSKLSPNDKNSAQELSENVASVQILIREYNTAFGQQPAYEAPIAVDGILGPATARALINVAARAKIEEVFINVPSLD